MKLLKIKVLEEAINIHKEGDDILIVNLSIKCPKEEVEIVYEKYLDNFELALKITVNGYLYHDNIVDIEIALIVDFWKKANDLIFKNKNIDFNRNRQDTIDLLKDMNLHC